MSALYGDNQLLSYCRTTYYGAGGIPRGAVILMLLDIEQVIIGTIRAHPIDDRTLDKEFMFSGLRQMLEDPRSSEAMSLLVIGYDWEKGWLESLRDEVCESTGLIPLKVIKAA